jgi:hypothetical protein
MKSPRSLVILAVSLLVLAGCGDVKQSLGLGRSTPDEFAVVDRPPLSMPPDFGLRPPRPGAPRPQEVDMSQRANDVLFAGADKKADALANRSEQSAAEKALLAQSGADKAPSDIRSVINQESAEKVGVSEHLVQELLWWKKDQPQGTTVDAAAEAARIKEAKDKGEPINKGATPVIEKDKGGFLGL